MQTNLIIYFGYLASLSCAASASVNSNPSPAQFQQSWPTRLRNPPQKDHTNHQDPIMNIPPVQPPPSANDNNNNNDGDLTISDVLPKTRSINIFASLTRDIASVSGRLESQNPADNTTLLAPLNSAMQALPRKPWEDRPDDSSGVSASRNEDKAAENLRKFVEEHVVPGSPWVEGKEGEMKTVS